MERLCYYLYYLMYVQFISWIIILCLGGIIFLVGEKPRNYGVYLLLLYVEGLTLSKPVPLVGHSSLVKYSSRIR